MKYIYLLAITSILGCAGLKMPEVTNFDEFIPAYFNQNNDTLLFVNANFIQAPMYRKKLKANYTGNFLVIPKVKNESIETCRYVMTENVDLVTKQKITYTGSSAKQSSSSSYRNGGYTILDRKTGALFHNTTPYSKTNFANYLKALDMARLKK
jgi:hypothetical protein